MVEYEPGEVTAIKKTSIAELQKELRVIEAAGGTIITITYNNVDRYVGWVIVGEEES